MIVRTGVTTVAVLTYVAPELLVVVTLIVIGLLYLWALWFTATENRR